MQPNCCTLGVILPNNELLSERRQPPTRNHDTKCRIGSRAKCPGDRNRRPTNPSTNHKTEANRNPYACRSQAPRLLKRSGRDKERHAGANPRKPRAPPRTIAGNHHPIAMAGGDTKKKRTITKTDTLYQSTHATPPTHQASSTKQHKRENKHVLGSRPGQ